MSWGKKSRHSRKLQFSDTYGKLMTEFQQTAANLQQRRLWVLKILILPQNFYTMRVFQFQTSLTDEYFSTKFSANFLTAQILGGQLTQVSVPMTSLETDHF